MFIYKNIPHINISNVAPNTNPKVFAHMPDTLTDFCKSLESDDKFFYNHTHFPISSKTIRKFFEQIQNFLDKHNAIQYSIDDTLQMACIQNPLGITFEGKYVPNENTSLKVRDISYLYQLNTGSLWLPSFHQTFFNIHGKVPETVCVILRDYVKYVLRCEDKNPDELQIELSALTNAGVIDIHFLEQTFNQTSQNNQLQK